jgi:hypothetical protein
MGHSSLASSMIVPIAIGFFGGGIGEISNTLFLVLGSKISLLIYQSPYQKKGPPRRRPFLLIYLASLKNIFFVVIFFLLGEVLFSCFPDASLQCKEQIHNHLSVGISQTTRIAFWPRPHLF